ncbi:MAG: glycosyltransferase family 4 protein [Nostocaceae cyanobacterium]|nr:glycosyltransferase family 4 protein [Nostocaceae cyanobacterium]
MNILMLSSTFPYPPTRGGTQVRTFNLLKYLSQRHTITLVTQREVDVTDAEIASLRDYVDDLVIFNRPPDITEKSGLLEKIQRFSNFLQQGTPPHVLNRYSREMQTWIDNFVQSGKCDVITCEHSVNEIYVRSPWRKSLKTIVNVHSSVYGTIKNQLETNISENSLRDRLNLPLLHRYEQRYCAKFSTIVVTTAEDRQQIEKFKPPSQTRIIPNGVDLLKFHYRPNDTSGHRLIFIGAMDNLANIDAVLFFSNQVLPEIQKNYPNTTFDIVGSRPAKEILALREKVGINVTGRVDSMVEYLHKATICVVPMRTGFGIKNKTLEAMASGIPVVASDRGLEGLAIDGTNVPLRALRANTPSEYVSAISQLFEEPQLRCNLSHNARQLVESEYTWEIAGQRYEEAILSNVGVGFPHPR